MYSPVSIFFFFHRRLMWVFAKRCQLRLTHFFKATKRSGDLCVTFQSAMCPSSHVSTQACMKEASTALLNLRSTTCAVLFCSKKSDYILSPCQNNHRIQNTCYNFIFTAAKTSITILDDMETFQKKLFIEHLLYLPSSLIKTMYVYSVQKR